MNPAPHCRSNIKVRAVIERNRHIGKNQGGISSYRVLASLVDLAMGHRLYNPAPHLAAAAWMNVIAPAWAILPNPCTALTSLSRSPRLR